MTGVNTTSCTVCGRPDDNLSVPLGRCWSCIKAASAAWEAKIAADRDLGRDTLASYLSDQAHMPRFLSDARGRRQQAAARPGSSIVPSGNPVGRLRGLLSALNDAPEGSRNATLHWAACRVGEMLAVGELPDGQQAADTLAQVALATGLDPREVRGTIRSGFATSGVQL